ncbi:MAG: hypothetical protein CSA62_13020 [Planctomycetota bacterium]|nr:MAG: hypothetical protein CSA62_13020 [Planctomycetota bacterium]
MWRRLIYFFVLLGGGLAVLSLVVGPENLFDLSPVEKERRVEAPGGEVRVGEEQVRAGARQAGTPKSVGIQIEGGIEDLRREYEVTLPSGKKRVLLLYRLRSAYVQPSDLESSYLMRDVRVWFYRRVGRGEELRSVPVLRLDAKQMTAYLDTRGGALRIDESQDLLARDIEIYASPSGLEGEGDVPAQLNPRDMRLRMRSPRLRAEIGEERVRLRSAVSDGRIRIDVESQERPISIEGAGFLADLPVDFRESAARSSKEAAKAARSATGLPSRITIERDIVVSGLRAARDPKAVPWTVRGAGPMLLDESAQGGLAIRLSDSVEMEGLLPGGGGSSSPVLLTGERFFAWLGRGRIPGQVAEGKGSPRRLVAPELQALRMEGGEQPARLLRAEGQIEARRLQLSLDPLGNVARLDASGAPLLKLRFGKKSSQRMLLRSSERISWLRGRSQMSWLTAPLGLGLLAPELGFVRGTVPDEIVRIEGETEIVPLDAGGLGLSLLRCQRGALLFAQRSLGALEFSEWHGFGEARAEFSGARGPMLLKGSRGFFVTRAPQSSRVDFLLARPGDAEAAAVYFRGEGLDLTGHGRFLARAWLPENPGAGRIRRGSLSFVAAKGSTLDVLRATRQRPFSVEGIERLSFDLVDGALGWQRYRGAGLKLLSPDLQVLATELSRQGQGPWRLRRQGSRVELRHSSDRLAQLWAREVDCQARPSPYPLPRGMRLSFSARGKAELRVQEPSSERRFELDAEELRFRPSALPLLLRPLARSFLGGGAESILEAALGAANPQRRAALSGQWYARGDVRLLLSEPRSGGLARREFHGEQAWVHRGGRATRLLPAPGQRVRGFLDEPGSLRCVVEAELLRTRGQIFELGRSSPKLWITSGAGQAGERRLLLEPSGRIDFELSRIFLPGPVRMTSVETRGAGEKLELRSGGDVDLRFDPVLVRRRLAGELLGERPVLLGHFGLPAELLSIVAKGGVTLRRGPLFGECREIALDAKTGWARLRGDEHESVRVRWHEGLLVDAWPAVSGIQINLETLEMRGGSGRLFRSGSRRLQEGR